MKLWLRKIIGDISKDLFPVYSGCGRCKRTWNVCKSHATDYSEGQGCFVLCEECWTELSIEERLPYYEDLIFLWRSNDDALIAKIEHMKTFVGHKDYDELTQRITKAVRAGK